MDCDGEKRELVRQSYHARNGSEKAEASPCGTPVKTRKSLVWEERRLDKESVNCKED